MTQLHELSSTIQLDQYEPELKFVIKYSYVYVPMRSSLAYIMHTDDVKDYLVTMLYTPVAELVLGTPVLELVTGDPAIPNTQPLSTANLTQKDLRFGHIVGFDEHFNTSALVLISSYLDGKQIIKPVHVSRLGIK